MVWAYEHIETGRVRTDVSDFRQTFAEVVLKTLEGLSNVSKFHPHKLIQNAVYTQPINGWFSNGHDENWLLFNDVAEDHPTERVTL